MMPWKKTLLPITPENNLRHDSGFQCERQPRRLDSTSTDFTVSCSSTSSAPLSNGVEPSKKAPKLTWIRSLLNGAPSYIRRRSSSVATSNASSSAICQTSSSDGLANKESTEPTPSGTERNQGISSHCFEDAVDQKEECDALVQVLLKLALALLIADWEQCIVAVRSLQRSEVSLLNGLACKILFSLVNGTSSEEQNVPLAQRQTWIEEAVQTFCVPANISSDPAVRDASGESANFQDEACFESIDDDGDDLPPMHFVNTSRKGSAISVPGNDIQINGSIIGNDETLPTQAPSRMGSIAGSKASGSFILEKPYGFTTSQDSHNSTGTRRGERRAVRTASIGSKTSRSSHTSGIRSDTSLSSFQAFHKRDRSFSFHSDQYLDSIFAANGGAQARERQVFQGKVDASSTPSSRKIIEECGVSVDPANGIYYSSRSRNKSSESLSTAPLSQIETKSASSRAKAVRGSRPLDGSYASPGAQDGSFMRLSSAVRRLGAAVSSLTGSSSCRDAPSAPRSQSGQDVIARVRSQADSSHSVNIGDIAWGADGCPVFDRDDGQRLKRESATVQEQSRQLNRRYSADDLLPGNPALPLRSDILSINEALVSTRSLLAFLVREDERSPKRTTPPERTSARGPCRNSLGKDVNCAGLHLASPPGCPDAEASGPRTLRRTPSGVTAVTAITAVSGCTDQSEATAVLLDNAWEALGSPVASNVDTGSPKRNGQQVKTETSEDVLDAANKVLPLQASLGQGGGDEDLPESGRLWLSKEAGGSGAHQESSDGKSAFESEGVWRTESTTGSSPDNKEVKDVARQLWLERRNSKREARKASRSSYGSKIRAEHEQNIDMRVSRAPQPGPESTTGEDDRSGVKCFASTLGAPE